MTNRTIALTLTGIALATATFAFGGYAAACGTCIGNDYGGTPRPDTEIIRELYGDKGNQHGNDKGSKADASPPKPESPTTAPPVVVVVPASPPVSNTPPTPSPQASEESKDESQDGNERVPVGPKGNVPHSTPQVDRTGVDVPLAPPILAMEPQMLPPRILPTQLPRAGS